MCGIAGIVRSDGAPVDRELVTRMNEAIRHRGPDEDGFYFSAGVGLAMRRLAIIDLKSGQQPIHNQTAPLGSFSTEKFTTIASYAIDWKGSDTSFTPTVILRR